MTSKSGSSQCQGYLKVKVFPVNLEMFKISVSKRVVDHPLRGVLAINVIVIFTLMAG